MARLTENGSDGLSLAGSDPSNEVPSKDDLRPGPIVYLTTRPQEVQESVIERLESALARAKAGEFVSVGIVYVTCDGAIGTGYSKTDDIGRLLGAASLLTTRIASEVD